jgi:hypothetical protein
MSTSLNKPRPNGWTTGLRPVILAAAISVGLLSWAGVASANETTPSLEEMWQLIQQQQAEIDQLKKQNMELREKVEAPAPALAASPVTAPVASSDTPSEGLMPEPTDLAPTGTTMEIYGAAMLDMGYARDASNPDWFDVLRPTKLPAFEDEYGKDGDFWAGVRQSRLGFRTFTPTDLGELKTIFEFELFGVGSDAGQTTFRLRHAWGELGQWGAGQTWSPFMDPDVFPNSIEYWGPNGMVFFRNVQLRWTPWQEGGSNFMMALERPGASADRGNYSDRIELDGIKANFPLPDFTAHYKYAQDWGHVQVAGILRRIEWDDLSTDSPYDLSGGATGWGINLSTNINLGRHVFRGSVVYGEGMENYMNDAPVDIGIQNNFGNPVNPIKGVTLPVLGIVAFLDLNWSEKWTSTIGYSYLDIDNSDGQAADAFRKGQYALANILYHPLPNLFFGPEIQYGQRNNYLDGFSSDNLRLQFSVKWNFDKTFGGF